MTINLSKGDKVDLSKGDGTGLKRIELGVGWDAARKGGVFGLFGGGGGEIDLDASCAVFSSGRLTDKVWFQQLRSKDGSIRHSGDNLTGDGDGDDEVITVDLAALPAAVDTLVLTVNSFRGQKFSEVANAYGRVVDAETGKELAKYSLSDSGPHTGMIIATLKRTGAKWQFTAVGERAQGRTLGDMQQQMERLAA